MGWRKRVEQIAANHPDKLHPIIRRARGTSSAEVCWDRADWQQAPVSSGRPIHLALRWLRSKSLLTAAGEAELAKAERQEYDTLFLAPSLVAPRACDYLSRYYRQWYEEDGINYGIDPTLPFDDAHLDRLWDKFCGA